MPYAKNSCGLQLLTAASEDRNCLCSLEAIPQAQIHAPRLFDFSSGSVLNIGIQVRTFGDAEISSNTELAPGTAKIVGTCSTHQAIADRHVAFPKEIVHNRRPQVNASAIIGTFKPNQEPQSSD